MAGFDVHKYELDLSRHTYIRMREKGITPETMKAVIYGGRVQKHGKNYVKFIKEYQDHTITCIGELKGKWLKIITITKD